MSIEKTYIMIKPDGVPNADAIKGMITDAGFTITREQAMRLTVAQVEEHYDFLMDKPFFPKIVETMTGADVIAMIVEGPNAILGMREIMGATDPLKAEPGTIRAKFGKNIDNNVIHGSDSPESATKELKRFFPEA